MVGLGPRKPQSRKGRHPSTEAVSHLTEDIPGSMADVPKDLLEQIKELERLFTVDQAKLKKITEKFVKELEKGTADSPTNLQE